MSSNKTSENNDNYEKNITQKDNINNSKENKEENKEKEKISPQIKDIKNSEKSNQSLSKVLDEKEIYNFPISIEKSSSNSNNNSKSDEKSENQENNQNLNINLKQINPKAENNINNNNDVKLNEINNNINISSESDNEIHETEGPIGMSSAAKDPEEYRHLRSIVSAFFNYQIDSLRDVSRMERDFKSIGENYTKRLSFNYTERIEKLKKSIWLNYSFLLKIADPYKNMFKLFKASSGEILMEPLIVEVKDIIKMRSTLKLFIRD